MIDFNYTAPELLPMRIQEVLDAPSEPHRIGNVVYVPEGGLECEIVYRDGGWYCTECKEAVGCDDPWCESYINGNVVEMWSFCPACGRRLKR